MIAAIDDDSDPDTSPQQQHDRVPPSPRRFWNQSGALDSGSPRKDASSSENDDPTFPASRGKLVARLKPEAAETHGTSQSDDNDVGDAYSRLKQRLAARSAQSPSKENSIRPSHAASSTDEDEILPNISRRRRRTSQIVSHEAQSRDASNEARQRSSPGLFLTPQKQQNERSPSARKTPCPSSDNSESELPADPQASDQLLALVARRREEREAKAKAEAEKKARQIAQLRAQEQRGKNSRADLSGSSEADSDDAAGETLARQTRPMRKASKKALEEMNRETQRISRNMQLAHQARTKKKITKESLFARFNFRGGNLASADAAPIVSSSTVASSNPVSDAEGQPSAESPPTSPMGPDNDALKKLQPDQQQTSDMESCSIARDPVPEEDLPDVQSVLTMSQAGRNKDILQTRKKPTQASVQGIRAIPPMAKAAKKKQIQVRLSEPISGLHIQGESESDLEIIPVNKPKRKLDVFDRLPAAKVSEGRSLKKLRALAHLTSPDRKSTGTKFNMSLTEMQVSLQRRARQQAARERAERIQILKDKGVIIQTAEERQKDQAEVEDLLEKARREASELKQKEKNVAKDRAKANGVAGIADDSDDEDEDYQENDADESNLELSGSEEEVGDQLEANYAESEEEVTEEEGDLERDANVPDGNLIEDEASEDSDEGEEGEEGEDDDRSQNGDRASDSEEQELNQAPMRRRQHKIIEDDEDEEIQESQGKVASTQASALIPPDLGLPAIAGASMGMTQAFAATMAESQTQEAGQHRLADQEEDSLAFLGAPPEPQFPVYDMADSPQMILDSQEAADQTVRSENEIRLDFSQSQIRETPVAENLAESTATQTSEIPDPTQDIGFALTSPVAGRYASFPPSTVDTVIIPQLNDLETVATKKRGRLIRKTDTVSVDKLDKAVDAGEGQTDTFISANAFDVLKKDPKKSSDMGAKFDKKKSNAQEMVEEQAQESEDEYAGLGGASDDESGGEEDEEVRKMIDQGEVDVNERELAAFYA